MKTKGNAAALLSGIMEPLGRCLTPASARQIVRWRANAAASRRIEALARRSDEGLLTPEECAEYRLFVEVGDIVALLQAKARRYLAEHSQPS